MPAAPKSSNMAELVVQLIVAWLEDAHRANSIKYFDVSSWTGARGFTDRGLVDFKAMLNISESFNGFVGNVFGIVLGAGGFVETATHEG